MLVIEDAFKLYREMDVVGVERDSCLKKKNNNFSKYIVLNFVLGLYSVVDQAQK